MLFRMTTPGISFGEFVRRRVFDYGQVRTVPGRARR